MLMVLKNQKEEDAPEVSQGGRMSYLYNDLKKDEEDEDDYDEDEDDVSEFKAVSLLEVLGGYFW